MSPDEQTEQAAIEQIQFSIDAIGTIINTDLPKITQSLTELCDKIAGIENRLIQDRLNLKELGAAVQDANVKLDLVLAKLDLLEKRIAEPR